MTNFARGVVKKATFEIEYPDGSRKTAELDAPGEVGVIVLDESRIPAEDAHLFNVSESDWKENPSMIVYPRPSEGDELDPSGIPFCTHNGCKA